MHQNFLHALFNVVALVPLLERFEAEHGTLLTGAMFAGRMCLLQLSAKAIAKLRSDSFVNDSCGIVPFDRARGLAGKHCCFRGEV